MCLATIYTVTRTREPKSNELKREVEREKRFPPEVRGRINRGSFLLKVVSGCVSKKRPRVSWKKGEAIDVRQSVGG